MAERRQLSETSLPRLLLELHRGAFDGALTLSRERVGKRFLFHEGVPIFAESTLPSESLGVQLMDVGTITRADYSQIVAYVQRHGCKEGKALLALGLLDAKGLFAALKDQVRLRLLECFGWPNGEFVLDDQAAPNPDAQPFRIDLYRILQEGLETHWSPDRVLADLAPRMQLYPRAARGFRRVAQRLAADASVEELFEAMDGSRTLWKAVQLAKTPRALASAWVLDGAEALEYGEDPVASEEEAPEPDLEIVFGGAAAGDRAAGKAGAAAGAETPGAAAEGAPGAERADALAREIEEKHARLGELDCYALIGVPNDADPATLKRAYLSAAKTYHPDALARAHLPSEIRDQANRVFAEIGKAYALLGDPRRRAEYDRQMSGESVDVNALAQAETLYRKGDVLLRQGNFRGALEFLRPAVELWPQEAAYQSALGWVYYKKLPCEPDAAREHLERAVEIDPHDGVALFRLGVVLRAQGESERAAMLLTRAERAQAREKAPRQG